MQSAAQSAAEIRAIAQSRVRLELLANLVRKDLKVKYKNSALGFMWSLANPLLYLAVFGVVFTKFLKNGIPDFWVLFMAGLLVWNFFNLSTLSATGSVIGNANLVRKVRFPRVVLPLSSVGFAGVHFLLQMGVLLLTLTAFYRLAFGPQLLLVLPALVVVMVFTVGMALLASSLNVRYRDVEHLLEIAMIAWFWLTPIVYSVTQAKSELLGRFHNLLWYVYMGNPMTAVVTSMQRAIYRTPTVINTQSKLPYQVLAADGYRFYLKWLAVDGLVALVVLAVGLWMFRRLEGDFAEEL
jgi:ABC-2 type transport system permease protein